MARRRRKKKGQGTVVSMRLKAARWLLLAAMAISIYLAYVSLSGGAAAGCGAASGCNKVLQSRWAYWLGLPVSLPAIFVDAALLGGTFWIRRAPGDPRSAILIPLCFLVMGAALWFTGIQAFVLRAFCPFCMTAHAAGFGGALLLFLEMRGRGSRAAGVGQGMGEGVETETATGFLALAGGGMLAALVVIQVVFPARLYQLKSIAERPAEHKERWVVLHDGQFKLDATALPIIGSSDATNLVVSLFDYSCHYCRELHPLLIQAQRQYGSRLAILNLPMPLDSDCNHWVRQTPPAHVHACEYARLGLAVWRSDRRAFEEFDAWIFQPSRKLSVAEARAYAEQLIGADKLTKASADPWVNQQLQTDVELYGANGQKMHSGQIPQLMMGSKILMGPVGSLAELKRILEENLALR